MAIITNNFQEQHSAWKHKDFIKALIKPLMKEISFAGITAYIILKSGQFSFLSTHPEVVFTAMEGGYDQGNILTTYDFMFGEEVIFPADIRNISELQADILDQYQQPGFHFGYAIKRHCEDCCVLMIYHTKQEVQNHHALYRHTRKNTLAFMPTYFDHTISLYVQKLRNLDVSKFAIDADFRRQVIDHNYPPTIDFELNNVERSILYWTSKGKKASEQSNILKLSKNTINAYRSRIVAKMNVGSISEASIQALRLGFIV